MSYYDHASAMALKLNQWSEERKLRNFELEAQACEQRASEQDLKKPSLLKRCLAALRRQ